MVLPWLGFFKNINIYQCIIIFIWASCKFHLVLFQYNPEVTPAYLGCENEAQQKHD
jgi:hypothetical protein